MTEEKKSLPKPFVAKAEGFKQIYVTGAFGNPTPFDFRIMFYTHTPDLPNTPTEVTGFPLPQYIQVELVMSKEVAKQLRDMLNRQVEAKVEQTKGTKEKGK